MIAADLHIHSRFSRATSPRINFLNLAKFAKAYGISVLGTGDFTHPEWRKEMEVLEDEEFLYHPEVEEVKFMPTVEISVIYKEGRMRKVHLLIITETLEVADAVTDVLKRYGRVDYDGRPIFGVTLPEITEALHEVDRWIEIIPAHAWTPWFGIFGSKSGFDSIEEAFKDQAKRIHAIETGLSSDPEMNRLVPQVDNYHLVSFSDAHSVEKVGRELTIFSKAESPRDIIESIRKGDLEGTIEVDPAFGKYHYDGHRLCNYSVNPLERDERICPRCGKPLTIGVLHRVKELAGRKKPALRERYWKVVPLRDLLAAFLQAQPESRRVREKLLSLRERWKDLDILLNVSGSEIDEVVPGFGSIIEKNRRGEIRIVPGYDGLYGKIEMGKLTAFF